MNLRNLAVWGVILMALSVPLFVVALVAGIGLKKGKRFGRAWGFIAASLSLLEIPIGTVIGVYALRVLTDRRSKEVVSQA